LKNSNNGLYVKIFLVLGVIIGGVIYLFNASIFERNAPIIKLEHNGFWNLKEPLKVTIEDQSGVKFYKVSLKTAKEEKILNHEQLMEPSGVVNINIEPIKSAHSLKNTNIEITVEATDASKWHFFSGNSAVKTFALTIDKTKPLINIIGNSYKITKGGSALVVFKATDENMKDFYIETSFNKIFKAQPFYKEGFYIALIAWPITQQDFKATVVATDMAGNVFKSYIPLYLQDKTYKISNITLEDKFLKGKIAELADEFDETQSVENSIEQFKIINETIRAKNEDLIHEITSKISTQMISDFKIEKMYPLVNGQVVANFGDHRKYFYEENLVSEAYHVGLDLASNAMSQIKPQNGGNVVYSDFNGLYGNMPILHHGLGLYTLYGHCSSINVNRGDAVAKNTHIASTGKSGYAMGDHLHFGVLVQGVEVRPEEWMDEQWIQLNVTDVIKSSKEVIDRN